MTRYRTVELEYPGYVAEEAEEIDVETDLSEEDNIELDI